MENYNHAAEGSDNEQKTAEGLTPELRAKLEQIEVDSNKSINKKDRKIGPLIAAVVVLLAISAAAIAFTMMKKDVKPSIDPATATATEEPTNEPIALTDEAVIAKINQRIDEVNLINYGQYSTNKKGESTVSAGFMYKKNGELFDNLGLTDKEKVFVTAAVLQFSDENALEKVTKADYKAQAVQEYKDLISETDFVKNGKKISAEKFAARYKEIFGEEVKHQTVNECGAIAHYSSDTGNYYFNFVGGCGGADMRAIIIKKDEYKVLDNEYYLDATVATVYDGQDVGGNNVCAVFDGYYNLDTKAWNYNIKDERIAKSCKGGETAAEFGALIETGTKFRYTFDKDFHFIKIERIKE